MYYLIEGVEIKVRTNQELRLDSQLCHWDAQDVEAFWTIYNNATNSIHRWFNDVLEELSLTKQEVATCRELKKELEAFEDKRKDLASALSNRPWIMLDFYYFAVTMETALGQLRTWCGKLAELQRKLYKRAKKSGVAAIKGKKPRATKLIIQWKKGSSYVFGRLLDRLLPALDNVLRPYLSWLYQCHYEAGDTASLIHRKLQSRGKYFYQFFTYDWDVDSLSRVLEQLYLWNRAYAFLIRSLAFGDDNVVCYSPPPVPEDGHYTISDILDWEPTPINPA